MSEQTPFMYQPVQPYSVHPNQNGFGNSNSHQQKSSFFDDLFDKKNRSSPMLVLGVIVVTLALVALLILLLSRIFMRKKYNKKHLRNYDKIEEIHSSRGSMDSTLSYAQDL